MASVSSVLFCQHKVTHRRSLIFLLDSLLIIFDEVETVAEEHSIAMDVETQDSPTYDAKGKRKDKH